MLKYKLGVEKDSAGDWIITFQVLGQDVVRDDRTLYTRIVKEFMGWEVRSNSRPTLHLSAKTITLRGNESAANDIIVKSGVAFGDARSLNLMFSEMSRVLRQAAPHF